MSRQDNIPPDNGSPDGGSSTSGAWQDPSFEPNRLKKLRPEELSEAQRALYDDISGGPRSQGPQRFGLKDEHGSLVGPFNAFLLQPKVGGPLQALGAAIRYETSLSNRQREIAILIVAEHWDSSFERYAHEAIGRAVGLTEVEIEGLRNADYSPFHDPAELAFAKICHSLAKAGDLDTSEYDQAVGLLGESGLFELLSLVGYYATLALQLRVFRIPSPD